MHVIQRFVWFCNDFYLVGSDLCIIFLPIGLVYRASSYIEHDLCIEVFEIVNRVLFDPE